MIPTKYSKTLNRMRHLCTFNEVIEGLDKHFEPQTNKSYETFLFRQMKQLDGENLNQFYIRLKEQEESINFANKRSFRKNNYSERGMSNKKGCGGKFPHKTQCPALGKTCNKCSKKNHFAAICKTSLKREGNPNNSQTKLLNSIDYTHSPSELYENLELLHLDETLFVCHLMKIRLCVIRALNLNLFRVSLTRVFLK